ncbi:MAG: rhomboid family intramembrane serine protease [Candidatus Cybelea sp.]
MITLLIIVVNFVVFGLELINGDAFVAKWSLVPADISSGHHLMTILTAMFMHASWAHILGNMVFLWAFGPEIEDSMGPWRYSVFYLLGGVAAMGAQVAFDPIPPCRIWAPAVRSPPSWEPSWSRSHAMRSARYWSSSFSSASRIYQPSF